MTDKKIKINLVIGVILSLAFILFSFSGTPFLEKLELGIYDLGSGLAYDDNLNPGRIVLVEIDDKSLDELGSWPWPRSVIADMIDILNKKGAKTIGLNISVDEAEHNKGLDEIRKFREKYDAYPAASNDASLKKWVLDNLGEIEKRIDSDSNLSNSIKNAGNVILPVYVPPQKNPIKEKTPDESFILKNTLNASSVSSMVKTRLTMDNLIIPISELGNNSAGVGIVTAMAESPGRSFPAFVGYNGIILPSFPLRLAASYLGIPPEALAVKDNEILLGDRSIPLMKGGILLKFRDDIKRFSFASILTAKSPDAIFKDKAVIIGFNDFKSRLLDMPGIMTETQFNALVLDNIINSGAISRPAYIKYLETLLILMAGIAVAFIYSLKSGAVRPVMASAVLLLIISAGLIILIAMGVWLKTVYISGCLVSVYLALAIKNFVMSGVIGKESPEEARLLALSYRDKGLPDQAFRKLQRLPPDDELKELIYGLGLEYENNNKIDKAREVYEHLSGLGGYRDVEERIARLKMSDESTVTGSFKRINKKEKAHDSEEKAKTHIGRYEILGVLGKGSMGLVYKAQDPKINRQVAIKTMRFSDEFEEDLIHEIKERFFREAEIAGQLSHPSIVTIHDVGDDGELTYMAMEFLEGEDLDKFITREKLLPFRRVLDVVFKIAEALDYAHKADVIHRDIKPANVMLLKNGNIKVTDFGIAKAISSSRTKTGVILGTPNYMSPEQIMGQKIDSRSDIFSLGVLFYQMITGELPFHGDNLSGLLYQITQTKHPSPRSHNPKIPGICEQILDKALAKDPNKRFRSAGEMARVINALGKRIDQMRIEKSSIK
jgi:eukaryotic-like serine/threonine-protein kinase